LKELSRLIDCNRIRWRSILISINMLQEKSRSDFFDNLR
jgi:hypothetical protein